MSILKIWWSQSVSERAFLKAYDPEVFPRPSVTVDLVLMSVVEGRLAVLLTKRKDHPAKGLWALPGGFVGIDESIDDAAKRLMATKAKMPNAWLEQLYTFGDPKRDPRMRIISVAYFALLPPNDFTAALRTHDELALAQLVIDWNGEDGGPVSACREDGLALKLAFDHSEILGYAVLRLRGKLDYTSIGFALLPKLFTLRQLQDVHEAILGIRMNKPAFRRRLLDKNWLVGTGEREVGASFRPAELYRFKSKGR
jgi:8-oxo-dGTP diphosphatase